MERNYRLDKIAGLLMELNADFVILNEVDFDSSWSFSVDQARYLAETAGYRYWAEERNLDFRILFWKWRFGNAVLSRYPIREARIIDFPEFSPLESFLAGKKRGIDCIIDLNGKTWRILGVHLSHRSEEVRARSAGMLLEISDSNPVPTIIAGDFNSSPPGFPGSHSHPEAGNAIAVIDDGKLFQRYPQEPPETSGGYTFHAARPIAVIDWIFIPVEHQIQNFRVVSSTLSDHRPVVAEVSKERTRTIIEQE